MSNGQDRIIHVIFVEVLILLCPWTHIKGLHMLLLVHCIILLLLLKLVDLLSLIIVIE
jgi:hypothetical protein